MVVGGGGGTGSDLITMPAGRFVLVSSQHRSLGRLASSGSDGGGGRSKVTGGGIQVHVRRRDGWTVQMLEGSGGPLVSVQTESWTNGEESCLNLEHHHHLHHHHLQSCSGPGGPSASHQLTGSNSDDFFFFKCPASSSSSTSKGLCCFTGHQPEHNMAKEKHPKNKTHRRLAVLPPFRK